MDQPICHVMNSGQRGAASLKTILVLFTGSLMLLVITATAVTSFDRFRDYVSQQLEVHARDGATAIGLSLSNAIDGRDPVAAASLVDAVFDSGRYLSIRYLSPQGDSVVARESRLSGLNVPSWFVSLVSLPTPTGEAAVVHGWTQLGSVEVVSHPGPAYEDLWSGALHMLAGAMIIGGLGAATLVWLTGRLLRPLRALEVQAEALGSREFGHRVKPHATRELNQVTVALNQMADNMEEQFEGQARLIEHLRRLNNEDAVTGLSSRAAFDLRLTAEIESEERAATGVLTVIHLAGFADYNLRHGRDEADVVLVRVANCLQAFTTAHVGTFSGRRSGAEFALFIPASGADALVWVRELVSELGLIYAGDRHQETMAVHAGLADRLEGQSVSNLWAAADEALRKAQVAGPSGCCLADRGRTEHRSSTQWHALITEAINANRLSLWAQPMMESRSGAIRFQQVSSRLDSEDGPVRASVFVPMAERFGLVADIDRFVIARSLDLLRTDADLQLSVTLGEGSMASSQFRDDLIRQMSVAGQERQRLMLGVSERALHLDRSRVAGLVRTLGELKVPVIADRFGVGGVPFSYLRNLSFTAVRIDHSFSRDVDHHYENRFFVESVVSIAHSAGKQVFVSGVETAAEYEALVETGVDGLMGYHLGRPSMLAGS
ncbi:EAL domain-containing protein [Marinobacter sp. CHS3-4]|uniref:bifunctional diguanylate cyclase/phosphodiesterase n=1 Tax=Marinobacter sp. CHS3-4 TaxID=3045174 RepID=UPI0024B61221|nr:EAL domain-containing protein [Marinobacter sp. CHS3-4]MDI9244303.1 EAL domain-containing protein [Marinobacter sp. CHS3-4]